MIPVNVLVARTSGGGFKKALIMKPFSSLAAAYIRALFTKIKETLAISWYLSSIYVFKINGGNIVTMCEIC